MPLVDLAGKSVVVMGGARGIGRAVVEALAEAGADVLVADILADEASAAAREIASQTGRRIEAVAADVTSLDDVKNACREAMVRLGKIDGMVNSAGWDRLKPFLKTTPDLWDRIIAINYRGAIHSCFAVLPHMVERQQGSIVNISSDSARVGSLGEAVYAGAKAAVVAFSKTLAREHARDQIRVNVVSPGLVETALLNESRKDDFGRKIVDSIQGVIPFKRFAKPEEIAPTVVFLTSDAARYITGQVVSVNGGLAMTG